MRVKIPFNARTNTDAKRKKQREPDIERKREKAKERECFNARALPFNASANIERETC